MRLSTFALILFATHAVAAAEVRFGPEIALSEPHAYPPTSVRLATKAGHFLAAWRDISRQLAVYLDGRPIPIPGAPRVTDDLYGGVSIDVASGPNGFLIVWVEESLTARHRILAIRVDLDGIVFDAAPIVVATEDYAVYGVAAAHDDSAFLISWGAFAVRSIRLHDFGGVIGPMTEARGTLLAVAPRILVIDNRFFNAWTEIVNPVIDPAVFRSFLHPALYLSPLVPGTHLQAVVGDMSRNWSLDFGAAMVGDEIAFAWVAYDRGSCVFEAQTDKDGKTLVAMHAISCGSTNGEGVGRPSLASDGNQLVVVWMVQNGFRSSVRGVRLGQSGAPIEDSFLIAPDANLPVIAPVATGVAIAYDRRTEDGTWRIFVRTLERLPSIPRVRAVRR